MKFAQLVIGPAGSGKSTFCETMKQYCDTLGRSLHVVNLDPAAENFNYPVSIDVRELISLQDVMEELDLGPNGCVQYKFSCFQSKLSAYSKSELACNAFSEKISNCLFCRGLLYCMEYLEENLEDWLQDELQAYGEDDYLFFDCPGQIELYSHLTVFKSLIHLLKMDGWQVGIIYCLDSQFTEDPAKYIAGSLAALSAMIQFELPHLNVLTKIDLVRNPSSFEHGFVVPDGPTLRRAIDASMNSKFHKLNAAVSALLDDYSMVAFVPLDITDEESIEACMLQVDIAVQYGEDQDVKIPAEFDPDQDE